MTLLGKLFICFAQENYAVCLILWCLMISLGKPFIFWAEGNSTVSLKLWSEMILLGKLFIFFAQEIILYLSDCRVK